MSPAVDLLTKLLVACGICSVCLMVQLGANPVAENPAYGQEIKTLDTPWRYTSAGWQDSTTWAERDHFPKPLVATVHPFVWTAMIMLAAIGLLVGSSKEGDSLVEPKVKPSRILAPHRCTCKPRCKNFCLEKLMPGPS